MAFLTSSVAQYLHDPGGLWEILILGVFDFIANYGWRIVFFTVCLKLLLFPLDLYQRIKMRKNQLITERIKPQLEKLQQQYAGDRQTLSQKQMELNKKEGFSYFSSCLPMIVTLVIFFYLFAGLNNISQYKNLVQYVELYDTYTAEETTLKSVEFEDIELKGEKVTISWNGIDKMYADLIATQPNADDYKNDKGEWDAGKGGEEAYKAALDAWNAVNLEEANTLLRNRNTLHTDHILGKAQDAVVEKYDEIKEGFLWIKNIWSPDVPWRKAILDHDRFTSNIGDYSKYSKAVKKLGLKRNELSEAEYKRMIGDTSYNNVTAKLRAKGSDHNGVNGFLILPILSVGLSFLSQFITSRLQKRSGQAAPEGGMAGSMKMMMVIMPLMMGFFALQYTAVFTLYIVVNSAMTILINVFTTMAMNGKSKHNEKKLRSPDGIQKYGRPDPKDL